MINTNNVEDATRDELIDMNKYLMKVNGELEAEFEMLRNEYKCIHETKTKLEDKIRRLEADIDKPQARITSMQLAQRYSDGMVAGLRYALRCNGIPGTLEVREA